jgi:hypothetical protein
MKKAFVLAMFCIILFGLWGWKKSKTSMTVVLPEKSVFFIDQDLSSSFKNSIENSIQKAYEQSKNPQEVMDQATAKFPEISSMKVQICQSDKICFYVDAAEPIFLLNNDLVVCDNATSIALDHFSPNVVQKLVSIVCHKVHDLQTMINFVTTLPDTFKQEFLIEWSSDTDILLQPKNGKNCILQCSADSPPSLQDLISCQLICEARKSKTKKKRVVYDVRFKNQIIVR